MNNTQQFLRKCTLILFDSNNKGIDLSELRIRFAVKRSDTATPNTADIRVYNLAENTAKLIQAVGPRQRVLLQAGYDSNYGVIFEGNMKQVLLGRENATDTYVDLIAGDGDRAYNFSIVNTTIASGSTQDNQINASITAMNSRGVSAGYVGPTPIEKLPRGKVMYGNARDYLRNSAQSTNSGWSIQDGRVNFQSKKSYLPGTAIALSSETGMIGTPQQTNEGVNVKCLLNPNIKISGRINLKDAVIERQKLNLDQIAAAKGDTKAINQLTPRGLNADGIYYVLTLEHTGDTRGVEWYSNLVTLSVDVTSNPRNSVQVGYGG